MGTLGSCCTAFGFLTISALVAPIALSQIPSSTQYPAGQYPPGQYPPGQYPPNTYPDNYPARLPGGVPVNIPIPQVKFPKKKDKAEQKTAPASDRDLKMSLRAMDGTLRELGEKDLYLDGGSKHLFRFRLLAKTRFRNKQGEAIRDSLLKPGDQVSVQVNGDDPETALRVVFLRVGTTEERATAAKPFDRASARVAGEADTKPAEVIEVAESGDARTAAPVEATDPAARPDERPRLARGPREPAAGNSESAAEKDLTPAAPDVAGSDEIVDAARSKSETYSSEIPDFLAKQVTTRYFSNNVPAMWKAIDVVEADVACVNGVEEYKNIRLNGRPANQAIEKTGAWSTGEFVTTLQDVLSPLTAASFARRREETVGNRAAYLYDFVVNQANSHWTVVAPDGRSLKPGYTGAIWIDKETNQVLRIEQRTNPLPPEFPYIKAESTLDYDFVRIEAKTFLLPVRSENLSCQRGTSSCWRNEIAFRNYRKFATDSNITFGKLRASQ